MGSNDPLCNSWNPVKSLSSVIESALLQKKPGLKYDLEVALRKNKPQFIALLKNPSRNPSDADIVRKAQSEGIRLSSKTSSLSGPPEGGDKSSDKLQKLSPQIVEEALILSELFNLNEIAALQLVLKGEEQLCQYPGLTRGLVAVLLYYDARKTLVQALRTLIQGREGITWTLELAPEVSELITQFTQQLLDEGLIEKVLGLLKDLSWEKEVMNLQKNMALGDAKHRRQVEDLFNDIKQNLADCVFCFAAQSGLPKNETIRLLDYLSKVKPGEGNGLAIDNTTMTLLMALLQCIDVSAFNKSDDLEQLVDNIPLLNDPTFIPTLHRELGPISASRQWSNLALQSVVQFAWAMTAATLRALTQNEAALAVAEDDEAIMDLALENNVFHFLPEAILESDHFQNEEFYIRRVHQLLTDFIVLMPLKVKELRNRADDSARNSLMHEQEGIQYHVPMMGQHFERLLKSISTLYKTDRLNLGLVLDYWCPAEGGPSNSMMVERFPHKQVSLYKFVRLAGDLLMPPLYTPYVTLLASLSNHPQSALHCFNLLKLNGLSSSGSQPGMNTVSWDHFFNSLQQYFANLRQEAATMQNMMPVNDTIYRMGRPMTRGISPAEIQGLVSVLKLIQTVCKNCEAAQVAMAENSNWQSLLVIIGLLSCPVPSPLKAELLKTLAAMSRSIEVAEVVWQNIESAQIINTVPGGSLSKHGLNEELENVETRLEQYSMTLGFLELMDILTENSIPENLGSGTRIPGFEPYLNFIKDAIFLRFHSRAYKNPVERWEVAAGCLKIIAKILADYSPHPQDFSKQKPHQLSHQQGHEHTPGKHPGFFIMIQLMQTSEFLRVILMLLDDGCRMLEAYLPFPGKSFLEESCLLSLKVLNSALSHQRSFMEAAKASNTPILLTPLDQLLQFVNPRSGNPDHMLNVCKFVTFSWWLPDHTLYAIKILNVVASSPSAQSGLLATLNGTEAIGKMIIKGFTEVLDYDEEEAEEVEISGTLSSIGAARIAIVKLLLTGLDKPAPSISHFLLGFDLKREVAGTSLQPPGVGNAIRTPFHAILSILRPTGPGVPSSALFSMPQLCENAYKLIYFLSANNVTSEPVLRYLRSSEDFLSTQLALLPLKSELRTIPIDKGISWLLKTLAIELKIVSSARLRSQVGLLINLLLDVQGSDEQNLEDSFLGQTHNEATFTQLSRTMATSTRLRGSNVSNAQHRLIKILNNIDFTEDILDVPTWELFDSNQVNKVLKSCEVMGPNGEKILDIQALHNILNQELSNLQGTTAMNQRQVIQGEIKSILMYGVQWNALQERNVTKKNILDGWRQVSEVMLCTVPNDILPATSKQHLLLDLLQTLLNKVLADGTMPDLANQVSGVVLLLLAALRETYSSNTNVNMALDKDNFVSILDSSNIEQQDGGSANVYSSALNVILKELLVWITSTSSSAQRVRANLYGALLNYLRIGKSEKAFCRSSKLQESEQAKFRKGNKETLLDFGDNFLEILCRDTVCGHDIRRMLALSVLDELVSLDGRGTWIYYMSKQGYLKHIIDGLNSEDEVLLQLLNPEPESNIRNLYTYETKMALLSRMAATVAGAEMLLESGLIARLSEMRVFSARPDLSPSVMMDFDDGGENFLIPSPLARYHQILFPVLRLCQALIASLGSQNRSVIAQVAHFIVANEELVVSILNARGLWSASHLQELSLVTGLVSRSFTSNNRLDANVTAHFSKLRRMMLGLIPHFIMNEELGRHVSKNNLSHTKKEMAMIAVLEINSNVLAFARNLVSVDTKNSSQVLFTPSMREAVQNSNYDDFSVSHSKAPHLPPSLGLLVLQIKSVTRHLVDTHAQLRDVEEKLKNLSHFSSSELIHLLTAQNHEYQQKPGDDFNQTRQEVSAIEKLPMSDKRAMALKVLRSKMETKGHEATLASTAVESGGLVLLKHLEYFLLHSTCGSSSQFQRSHRRLIDETISEAISDNVNSISQLSEETVERLKEEIRLCLNDAFYLSLEDVLRMRRTNTANASSSSSSLCVGGNNITSKNDDEDDERRSKFLDIVLRRLKRLSSLHT